jgi:hypothetical protein
MEERIQQLDSNSFFVSGISDLSESKLIEVLSCTRVRIYSWELTGEKEGSVKYFTTTQPLQNKFIIN